MLASLVLHLPVKLARGGRLWPINNLDRDVKWPAGYCSPKKGGEVFSLRVIVSDIILSGFSADGGQVVAAGQVRHRLLLSCPQPLLRIRPIIGQYLHVDIAA